MPRTRPKEAIRCSFKQDFVRDWKAYFESTGKRVAGIFGPSAPHYFEFRRRDSPLLAVLLSLESSGRCFTLLQSFRKTVGFGV